MTEFQAKSHCMGCMQKLPKGVHICPACQFDNAAGKNQPHQLPLYTILSGKYLVGCALGQGGFGITYIGWDINFETRIAIKEYYPDGQAARNAAKGSTVQPKEGMQAQYESGMEKFLNEAKVLAKFSNASGIVSVRDFFHENNTAYIIMEFVEGKTLDVVVKHHGGQLFAPEALELFKPLFIALDQIHSEGLLHRDISPDNIIVQPDGSFKLIDFGAARQMSLEGERSNTINVKHGYAPEEQYRTHGQQGPWTDVYALCASLYRVTTGRKPPQALSRIMKDTLEAPNLFGAKFTEGQQAVLLRGLSVRGSDRQQSMRELYAELYDSETAAKPVTQGSAASEEYEAAAAPGMEQSAPAKKARPVWLPIAIAGGVVLAIVVIMLLIALN